MATNASRKTRVVYYYPNLIGYVRILLTLLAVCCFKSCPWTAAFFYAVSQFLDAVDGHVARAFNQCSQMGAVLDQLTDRMSTVGIYFLLCTQLPRYYAAIFLLAVFDIAGHWCYTHAQLLKGAKSHKQAPPSWPLLYWYYTERMVMFTCHLCYETALVAVLVTTLLAPGILRTLVFIVIAIALPGASMKAFTNLAQIFLGGSLLVSLDESREVDTFEPARKTDA